MAKLEAVGHMCVVTAAAVLIASIAHRFRSSPALSNHRQVVTWQGGGEANRLNASKPMNAIDGCWRRNPGWALDRTALAGCAVGYGSEAGGGGSQIMFYTVNRWEDDAVHPMAGSLRHAVSRRGRVWVTFARDMNISLRMPLLVGSHKTIDGRGADVQISNGCCILLTNVHNVVIQGLNIHHCKAGSPGLVVWGDSSVRPLGRSDGDGISIRYSRHVWIDHNTLSHCDDSLLDLTLASTNVTISNNRFNHHNEVMLLGHSDRFVSDKIMRVTIVYNHFGPDCVQRMPRVRFGYVHIANNNYEPWESYAIGGSSHPIIRSEGNRFVAAVENSKKEVTKHMCSSDKDCKSWRWKSTHDIFLNGAYFIESGIGRANPNYIGKQRFRVKKGEAVPYLTADAGSLRCFVGKAC